MRSTTPEQDAAIIAAYERGESMAAIREIAFLSERAIQDRLRRAGVPRRPRGGRQLSHPPKASACDCGRSTVYARGLCHPCYRRWLRSQRRRNETWRCTDCRAAVSQPGNRCRSCAAKGNTNAQRTAT